MCNYSAWGVLDLFQDIGAVALALKNFCRAGKSHHRFFHHSDATSRLEQFPITLRTLCLY